MKTPWIASVPFLRISRRGTQLCVMAVLCILASCRAGNFKFIETQLHVSVVGNGLVQGDDGEPTCTRAPDSNCVERRVRSEGAPMTRPLTTLSATPADDSVFVSWSGDCSGSGSCTVDLSDADKSVTATFLKVAYKPLTVLHPNGDLTIAGTFKDATDLGAGLLSSTGGVDIFLVRISGTTGATLWAIRLGSSGTDRPESLMIDDSGNLVVTGYAGGGFSLGPTQLDCSAEGGQFAAIFAANTGTSASASCLAASL